MANTLNFIRSLDLSEIKHSAFLFGPRMTGKTSLLRRLEGCHYIDLLDPELELRLRSQPSLFWQEIKGAGTGARIIVDEIQRIPLLLDYVQKGIEELGQQFFLSGSSARKLKRGGANLLGGRALDLKLHPLSRDEIGKAFSIQDAVSYGTLPKILSLVLQADIINAKQFLKSYSTTYIREEIQLEALTRNVGAFQRFLNIAAQSNAQIIEYSNISRSCSVPSSTVREYFSILEDTLLGTFLWPWNRSERMKSRPKFYFFDCGVLRALQNRLNDPPTAAEYGYLFETWFIRELSRLNDYLSKGYRFSFWRDGNNEIDLLVEGGRGPLVAIEIKSGNSEISIPAIKRFKQAFPGVKLLVASENKAPLIHPSGVEILPYEMVLELFKSL